MRPSSGGTTFRSEHFTVEPVAKGVWAALGKPLSGAIGNAGIVDLGESTLIFDTFLTLQASADLRSAAQFLTGRNPSHVVNSHWHLDHTLGNAAFGASAIYGTEITRHRVGVHGPAMLARVADPSWVDVMAVLQTRHDRESRPLFRAEMEAELAAGRELRDARDRNRVRAPDSVFEGRQWLPGQRSVQAVAGAGHSESDTIVFVGDEEVLFAGDLVTVGVHPTLGIPDVPKWCETLDKIVKIDPKVIVPGHGPVTSLAACEELNVYLERLAALAADGVTEIPEVYADWQAPARFARNVALLRSGGASEPEA